MLCAVSCSTAECLSVYGSIHAYLLCVIETLGVELLILGDPSVKPLPRFAHIAAAVPSSTKPECKV